MFEIFNKECPDDLGWCKPNDRAFNPNISIVGNNERDLGVELGAAPAKHNVQRYVRNSLICNVILQNWTSSEAGIYYSRDNNHYAKTRIYHPRYYTRRNVIRAVESLELAGLVVDFRTAPSENATLRSWIKAAPNLINARPITTIDQMEFAATETILMKDGQKRLIDYRQTLEVRQMRRDVIEQNEVIKALKLDIQHPDWHLDRYELLRSADQTVNPRLRSLYRIFNNSSWKSGGRFYGGFWQQLSGHVRAALTIDGEPVVEHDYSRCHGSNLICRLILEPDLKTFFIFLIIVLFPVS